MWPAPRRVRWQNSICALAAKLLCRSHPMRTRGRWPRIWRDGSRPGLVAAAWGWIWCCVPLAQLPARESWWGCRWMRWWPRRAPLISAWVGRGFGCWLCPPITLLGCRFWCGRRWPARACLMPIRRVVLTPSIWRRLSTPPAQLLATPLPPVATTPLAPALVALAKRRALLMLLVGLARCIPRWYPRSCAGPWRLSSCAAPWRG